MALSPTKEKGALNKKQLLDDLKDEFFIKNIMFFSVNYLLSMPRESNGYQVLFWLSSRALFPSLNVVLNCQTEIPVMTISMSLYIFVEVTRKYLQLYTYIYLDKAHE